MEFPTEQAKHPKDKKEKSTAVIWFYVNNIISTEADTKTYSNPTPVFRSSF